jgi:hypothetical protein
MSAVVTPSLGSPAASAGARPDAPAAPVSAPPGVDDKADRPHTVVGAIERLALSRERLRDAMLPARRKRPAGENPLADGIGNFATGLVERVRAMPAVAVLIEAVEDWWARHPLHTAGIVAAEASRRIAAPVAERHPLKLLFGAVLVGALLALLKPWRWLLRPALFAGLLPALLARGVRELPIEHWLQLAAGLVAPRPPSRDARDEALAAAARATPGTTAAVPTPTGTETPTTRATQAAIVREEPSAVYP